jgi:hypothetical protein
MPSTMARLKGSRHCKPRERTVADKKNDAEAKSWKKVSDEATRTQRERNDANFRSSFFRHSSPPVVAAPAYFGNNAVVLHGTGIPCWAEQVDPEEITTELDYNLEEEQECNNADTSDTIPILLATPFTPTALTRRASQR